MTPVDARFPDATRTINRGHSAPRTGNAEVAQCQSGAGALANSSYVVIARPRLHRGTVSKAQKAIKHTRAVLKEPKFQKRISRPIPTGPHAQAASLRAWDAVQATQVLEAALAEATRCAKLQERRGSDGSDPFSRAGVPHSKEQGKSDR